LFNNANGVQPWPSQNIASQPHPPRMVNLELCMIWPWQRPQGRSILQINIVECQPDENCIPQPNTQIYGLGLGYIYKHFLLNQDFFGGPWGVKLKFHQIKKFC
jgi:hypothetical protein